jgi:glycosyltransferase involved in cell wall biosynthesis
MADRPLVSVVMATYNRAQLLSRSLDSILNQTYQNYEIIVVDDASPDSTQAVLDEYKSRYPNIKSLRNATNSGPCVSRNAAIQIAEGKYVAIMDDDDTCVSTRLEKQVEVLENDPGVGLCFARVDFRDEFGNSLFSFPAYRPGRGFPDDPSTAFLHLLLDNNKVADATIMARRDVLVKHPYPTDMRVVIDWYLALVISGNGIRMKYLPEIVLLIDHFTERQRLTLDKSREFMCSRALLMNICDEFDVPPNLRKQILSNQMAREAKFWGGKPGLKLVLEALKLEPFNRAAYRSLYRITFGRAKKKLVGKIGLGSPSPT